MKTEIALDQMSHLVNCQINTRWQSLEDYLNEAGFTLGYYNPKHARATIGALLEKNLPNLFYRQYGHPVDWCVSIRARGRQGQRYQTRCVPHSATGPNFNRILLSGNKLTRRLEDVTLCVRSLPERIDWHWSYWKDMKSVKRFRDKVEDMALTPDFIGVYTYDKQPRALQHENMILVSIRYAGMSGVVESCMDCTGSLMRRGHGITIRIARNKIVPLLEKLLVGVQH